MSLKSQLQDATKAAQQRMVEDYKRQKLQTELRLLKEAKKSKMWEVCEKNIWEKLERNLRSAANNGAQEYTYLVRSEDLKGFINTVYQKDLEDLRNCLISYVRSKGLICEFKSIFGHEYGRHVEIKW